MRQVVVMYAAQVGKVVRTRELVVFSQVIWWSNFVVDQPPNFTDMSRKSLV